MERNIPLSQGLSLKISDILGDGKTYPTGRLQKGFLLMDLDQELTEEAVGFGVPVLKRELQTIFAGAVVLIWLRKGSTWEITALFKIDLVERISKGGDKRIENKMFYGIKNFLEMVIRDFPYFRSLLTAVSSKLRQMFKWETAFVNAGLSNEVKVTYTVEEETGTVAVEIDASGLTSDITEVVMMNEQGAHYFDRYQDSSGILLQGDEIGCWDEVIAEEASFKSSTRQVAFTLNQVKGARLFRGRELVDSRLAWAGFGYSFPPTIKRLKYQMRIERNA